MGRWWWRLAHLWTGRWVAAALQSVWVLSKDIQTAEGQFLSDCLTEWPHLQPAQGGNSAFFHPRQERDRLTMTPSAGKVPTEKPWMGHLKKKKKA